MEIFHKTIVDLFKSIVKKYPDNIAIKDSNNSLTYFELDKQAIHIARLLVQLDIKSGTRIVCITKKDTTSVLTFWGILFSGGIPVLLESEDSVQINKSKIRDIHAELIIAEDISQFSDLPCKSISFSSLLNGDIHISNNSKMPDIYPEFCYIILTSGTSGTSKAVQISHTNLLHYTYSAYSRLGCPKNVKAGHVSTFAADLGLTNLVIALISGGTLRIFSKRESTDPLVFNSILNDEKISLLKITASHLVSLLSSNQNSNEYSINHLIVGGEKLTWKIVEQIFELKICCDLYNHYGPTETTVGALMYKVEKKSIHFNNTDSVPIGTPMGDMNCFLGDHDGDIGELYISGSGVSSGYFNNEIENSKKFVTLKIADEKKRFYKTGDICKKLTDGNFEFLYRTDRQVKIRGYRVELGEIEVELLSHPLIDNVIITTKNVEQHIIIEAYIKTLEKLEATELKKWLSLRIPTYKIPTNFYFYAHTPYNSNGKIDLNALKVFFQSSETINLKKVQKSINDSWHNIVEENWKKILNRSQLFEEDNFFEIGGDSLLAIQLIGRLQREGYKIHITDLNNKPIFREFASHNPEKVTVLERSKKTSHNHLTFSQRSYLQKRNFKSDVYSQYVLFETEENIGVRNMAMALNCIIEGHCELTKRFVHNDIKLTKKEINNTRVEVSILNNNISNACQIQETVSEILNKLSPENGILLKAHIFIDPKGKDYLFLACHHLVIDVISWNIIIEEILDYYRYICNEKALPRVIFENISNDFYEQIEHRNKQILPRAGLLGKIARLPLTAIFENSQFIDKYLVYSIVIPQETSFVFSKKEDQKNVMGGLLLSALTNSVLMEFDLKEISIDIEFHSRAQNSELPDLSRSVSWWSTTIPVNLEYDKADMHNCIDILTLTSEKATQLNLERQLQEFEEQKSDIRFNYLGHLSNQFGNSSLTLTPSYLNCGPSRFGESVSEYKIFFTSRFIGNVLVIDIQYQTNYFSQRLIESIAKRFVQSMESIIKKENIDFSLSNINKLYSNANSVGLPFYNLKTKSFEANLERGKTVFLTGATGFLGSNLLMELINSNTSKIYCLVRGEDYENSNDRLISRLTYYFDYIPSDFWQKVVVVNGDLLSDNFGINKDYYDEIIRRTDLIIHVAANINLTKGYSELIKTNLNSTNKIIDIANNSESIEVYYVSTLAVSGYSLTSDEQIFSEEDFDYGQSFISDYEKSKFEAEKMIRNYFANKGKGKIYRVGHIAADSLYGKFQYNIEQNRIFQIIKGIIILKQVPDNYMEFVSFSHVDIVSKGIAQLSLNTFQNDMICYHLENPYYISFIQIAIMIKEMGYEIEIVDIENFKQNVRDFDGTIEERKIVNQINFWVERFNQYPRKINYIQKKSLDTIAEYGLYFPKTDFNWLSLMIKQGIKEQYFPAPTYSSQKIGV